MSVIMEDVHVRGLSCVKIREVHPEVMPSRLRPGGWPGGRPKGSWEGVPAERRKHWKITEARTSGKVREEEKLRPCMGADVWQGTRLMSPGIPLPRGSGEQGTGRVLVLDISGPEQGIWQGALRNTEQSAGIGHILKGTEREKKNHLLKEAKQMSNAASKSRKRGYEEWLLNQALEAALNTLVSTVMRKHGEKPAGSDGRTSEAWRREAALREADCWEESAENNILTKSTVQWRMCELLAFCFVFIFSHRLLAPL